jgi:FixJ family two-component response regulator
MAGAKDYFQKPFDNDALMSAIHRELGEEERRIEASNC